MADELLDVVDENDVVVGQRLRSDIHKLGLLHREVHVWFVTPDGQVIFQKRGADKDTYPNMLDATVGGHVDPGEGYLEAALREIREETGMTLQHTDFVEVAKLKTQAFDDVRKVYNNPFRVSYLHIFRGRLGDLQVEGSDAAGFVCLPLAALQDHKADIVGNLTSETYQPMWNKIGTML